MSTIALDHTSRRGPETPPAAVVPYLAVAEAAPALDWYAQALGARLVAGPVMMPDGPVGHAEIEVAGGRVMLSDTFPEIGVVAPASGAGATVTLHATVDDVDEATRRVVEAGAVLERAPADHPHGRNAVVRDPFGHRWMLAGSPGGAHPRHGDIAYVSLWVPDVDRAARFFGEVVGWRYSAGGGPREYQVDCQALHHGIWGGEPEHTLFLCLAVDDLDGARERVTAAGGTVGPVEQEPFGRLAACADGQGMRFALFEAPPGPPGGPDTGLRPGDLAGVTVEVVDSAAFRRFFGAVAGWRSQPGHVADGWDVADVWPRVAIHGGHDHATCVPTYRVDDIDAAVARVRAAGGTAGEPAADAGGTTSACRDDQGTRFGLGTLAP